MKKNQKLLVYGGAGLLVAFLLFRWYSSRGGTATTPAAATSPTDQAASDYANLAGHEQADFSGLQAQEQQDIAGLGAQLGTIQSSLSAAPTQSDLASLQAQEQQDIAGLLTNLVPNSIAAPVAPAVMVAAGHEPAKRGPVRPAGAPANAVWAGNVKPGSNYHGIGGGWWAPVKTVVSSTPHPHSSAHQPGNHGHNGTAPAGHAVAPTSHEIKSSSWQVVQPPHPSGTQAHPSVPSAAKARIQPPKPKPKRR